jgi:ketosteroid isomerase-like protein
MSKNLELVRSIYAGWGRGDFASVEWADPAIEFSYADGPEPGRWSGLDAMSRHYGNWLSGFEGFRAEPEEYVVVDDHRILVLVRNSGRGKASGVEFEQRTVANFFEIHDNLVTRLILYWDRGQALADLGLAE